MFVWLRFLALFRPYRRRLAVVFLATLARPVLNAAKIYLLKVIVDNLAANPSSGLALSICGAYIVIALAKAVASFGDDYLGVYVGGRVTLDLRERVFRRLLGLSLRYHGEHRVGESISRLISDVGAVEGALISGLTDGLAQALTVVIYAMILFYLDPMLALLSLLITPFLFAALAVYARRSRAAFHAVRERLSELTGAAEEPLSTIALVKSFMRYDHATEQLNQRSERHWRARLVAARQQAFFVPLSDVIATVGTTLVVYFGAQALKSGTLTIGGLVIFLAYLGQLYNPLLSLSRLGNSLQGGAAAAERVTSLLNLPEDADEPLRATLPWRSSVAVSGTNGVSEPPAVVFDHVWFHYDPTRPILRDFTLTAPRGAIVALVGPSGAGKSTAIALLQRLYDPDDGRILLFGHDIREAPTERLRRQLAVVAQEPSLLMGSVRENIAYGALDAPTAAIERVSAEVGIDELGLLDGLDTEVGPRGSRLSGGQRQRVAIARALIRDAPILLLDEATSALDAISEQRLRLLLEGLRTRHTIILVAHRLSTVRFADRIAVVEQGHVVESGRHEELLARNGAYATLVRTQLVGAEPPVDTADGNRAPETVDSAGDLGITQLRMRDRPSSSSGARAAQNS